jgi:hypothetical protein
MNLAFQKHFSKPTLLLMSSVRISQTTFFFVQVFILNWQFLQSLFSIKEFVVYNMIMLSRHMWLGHPQMMEFIYWIFIQIPAPHAI